MLGLCPPCSIPLEQSNNKHHSCSCCKQNHCNSLAALQERRSGQHPVSTWIHGNIPMAGGWLGSFAGDASHWGALSKALRWSWAVPSASAKPAPLHPPNQDLGEKKLFPRATSPPGPWLSLTRTGISLFQTSSTSHPLGKMRLALCVWCPCWVLGCWEGAESSPHSQTPLRAPMGPPGGAGRCDSPAWPQVSARVCPNCSGDRAVTTVSLP